MPVDPILAALDAAERRPPAPPPAPPDPILAALDAVERRTPFNAPRMATAPPAAAVLPGPQRSVVPMQADGYNGPATVTPAPREPLTALSKATTISPALPRSPLTIAESAVRAPVAGVARVFTKPAWGALEAAADALGLESVAAWSRKAGTQADEMVTAIRGPQTGAGPTEQAVYGGLESVGVTVPSLVAGGMTGSPNVALGMMGAATAGETYPEARKAGVTPAKAAGYAAVQAAAEILTEKIPASRLLGDLAKRTGIIKTIIRQIAVEVPGEQVATVVQDMNDWATLNPDKPFSAYLAERPSAAAQTLIATLVGTVVQAGGAVAVDRLARPKTAAVAPPAPTSATPPPVGPSVQPAPPAAPAPAEARPAAPVAPNPVLAPDPILAALDAAERTPAAVVPPAPVAATPASPPVKAPAVPIATAGEPPTFDPEKPFTEVESPRSTPPADPPKFRTEQVGDLEVNVPVDQPAIEPTAKPPENYSEIIPPGEKAQGIEPWQQTRTEFRIAENKPRVEAIQAALKKGTRIILAGNERATRLGTPEHIRMTASGEVQIPQGRKWVTLTEPQIEALAAQAGVKPTPLDEKVYHHAAVEEAFNTGKDVPETVLVDYPTLLNEKRRAQGKAASEARAAALTPPRTLDDAIAANRKREADKAQARQAERDAILDEFDAGSAELDTTTPEAQTSERELDSGEGVGDGPQGRVAVDRVAASTPTRSGESPTQQGARRDSHYRDVFKAVYAHAKALDPLAKRAAVQAEFDSRVALLEELDAEAASSGQDPRDLLEAIAKQGGISIDAEHLGGLSGELERIRESDATGPYGNFGGVPNVFRKRRNTEAANTRTGLSLDEMATRLQQDARFSHIEGPNELLEALDDVARMGDVGYRGVTYPGTAELARSAGMAPDTAWWAKSWNEAAVEDEPTPVPYSKEAMADAFNLTPEQAEATDALVQAMGIDTDQIQVVKGGTPGRGSLEQDGLPRRTADTMSDAIAMSSPSGRVSKRAQNAATQRLSEKLFGPDGLQQTPTPQPSGVDRLRQHATRLRDLAARGMNVRAYTREATDLERRAKEMEADLLDTGEVQPRLPGAEDVREQDIKTPEFEAPFSLTPETSKAKKGRQAPLFQGAQGAVEFSVDGKAILRGLQSANVSTGLHEIAHVARRQLLNRNVPAEDRHGISDEDIAVTEQWAGATDGQWTVAAEEKFARGFERYLRDGNAPNGRLKSVFAAFKTWLSQVYKTLKGSALDLDISPEMRAVFDRLVKRSERMAEAEAAGDTSFDVAMLERDLRRPSDGPAVLYQKKPGDKEVTLKALAAVASRRRVPLETVRKVAEDAGYLVREDGPRPVKAETTREIPPAKAIDPKKLLEFPSIEKMPVAIRGDIADLLAKYQGFEAQRRGVQPIARTQELAKDVWLPLETLRPGTALNAEELNAYQTALATALTERQVVLEKIKDGTATDWDKLQFSHLTDVATILTASYRGAKAEAGRALNVLRVKARVLDLQESKFLEAALRAPGFQKDLMAVSKAALDAQGDPLKQLKLLRQRAEADWFDVFQAVYYANLLSGLKTHLRNTIGNSFSVLANTVTPVGAAAADIVRTVKTGEARSVFLGEIPQNVIGGFIGLHRGWQNAAFTFSEGFRPSAVAAATTGVFDTPRIELKGGLKNPFNWPSRSLEAADEFFRAVAFHQELYAGAYAQARRDGARTHAAISARMAEILAGTTGAEATVYETIAGKAEVFAARAVFQEEPGRIVRWLLDAKSPHQPKSLRTAALFLTPFVKTPSAILRQGAEWSPAGFFMKGAKEGTDDGKAREQSQAVGRALMGTAFVLLPIAWLAATGRLTGAPPDDPGDREEFYAQGKLANAVRIGKYWVRYVLFQPFSVPMAAVANGWEKFKNSEQDEAAAEEAFAAAVAGAAGSILDQSFLSGLGTFIDAVNDPTRYAGQWLNLFAQGFVPFSGLMRNVTQAVDPAYRKPQGVAESVQAIIPGQSSKLPPRRTRFGDEAKAQGSWLQRGFTVPEVSKVVDDEVTATLARLKIQPTTPQAKFTVRGKDVQLTREQQDAVIEAIGRERKLAVERAIQKKDYRTPSGQTVPFGGLPEEQQRVTLERAIDNVTERVRPRVLGAVTARRPITFETLASPAVREQRRRDQEALFGKDADAVAR